MFCIFVLIYFILFIYISIYKSRCVITKNLQLPKIRRQNRKGFTIVELLIVIVVIGILAAIVIVAFSGVQQRARDTIRKQNANDLAKALVMHYTEKGNYIDTDVNVSGDGWVNGGSAADLAAPNLVLGKLRSAGYLIGANIKDPRCYQAELAGCNGYIKITCGRNTPQLRAYVLVRLETVGTVAEPAEFSDCDSRSWWGTFGMNHRVLAQ